MARAGPEGSRHREKEGVYNQWTGIVDWTSGLKF